MEKHPIPVKSKALTKNALLAFWIAGAVQGILAISLVLGVLVTSKDRLSVARLLIAGLIMLPTIAFVILGLLHQFRNSKYLAWAGQRIQKLKQEAHALRITIPTLVVFLASAYMISVTPEISEPFTRNILENLLPLFIWLAGISTQILIFLAIPNLNTIKNIQKSKIFLLSIGFWSLVFLAWVWVALVSYPFESQVRGWNRQGVPVMETQVFLAWLINLAFLAVFLFLGHQESTRRWLSRLKPTHLDLLICLLLWISAVLFWQSIPIPTSWFVTENRPPNFEPYPNSDAYHYDISAQSALVGEGFIFFDTPFIRRPLHAAYLTFLHFIAGQDYSQLMSVQLLFLAFLPVAIYLVVRSLHNRMSGILAAILILVREASSIAISGNITASHVKLLMVDVPVTLFVTLFVLSIMRWLSKPKPGYLSGLVAGGVLGASILIRAETVIFTIPIVILLWLALPREKRWRTWLTQVLLFAWGIFLILTPWVVRNWSLTGDFFLDSPIARFDLIEQRFQSMATPKTATPSPTQTSIASVPTATQLVETEPTPILQQAYPSPLPTQIEGSQDNQTPEPQTANQPEQYVKSVSQKALEFITQNPGELTQFIFSHFVNSQVQTLLILPSTWRPLDSMVSFLGHRSIQTLSSECCSMQNYTRRLPFWHKWDATIPYQSSIPIILNILLVSWGFQIAWQRKKIAGLAPILLCITYISMNALFRNSGGRYILPVDWILLGYFSIGLADLTSRMIRKILHTEIPAILEELPAESQIADHGKPIFRSPKFYSLSIGLLLVGSLLPLTELAFPPRYTSEKQSEMTAILFQSDLLDEDQKSILENFMANGGSITTGRALYPRFFREFLGEPGSNNPFGPKPYPRIGFYLAGPQHFPVVLPSLTKPGFLPHTSDVLVFLCSPQEIFAVAVFDQTQNVHSLYLRSPLPLEVACPFPDQELSFPSEK